MAEILKGKPVADAIKSDIAVRAERLKAAGRKPLLAVMRAGERQDDIAYENRVIRNCSEVGIETVNVTFPADVAHDTFTDALKGLSGDRSVHGILVLRPLPQQVNSDEAGFLIDPRKDVDCMNPENLRKVFMGDAAGIAPCTPEAVIEILKFYGHEIRGKNVVIINRSLVLGRPLAMLFLAEDATVTICHSRTEKLAEIASGADILVSGVGKPEYFGKESVSPYMTVIDVGINFTEKGMCGDMKYDEVRDVVSAISPVPGGVGTVTSAILLRHLIESAEFGI